MKPYYMLTKANINVKKNVCVCVRVCVLRVNNVNEIKNKKKFIEINKKVIIFKRTKQKEREEKSEWNES